MNAMKRAAVLLLLVSLSLYGLTPVEALSITGLTVTLTCTGFTYSDFSYSFNRDNTGTGSEAYQIIVKDSADNVIHLTSNTVALSGPYSETGASASYNLGTAVPGAVTYQWISQAGNGLEELVAFSFTGYCGDAPTATPSPTPAPTATPGPSPTPTPTITPTPNVSDLYDVGGTPVLIVREVTPGDVATIGLLALIAGLLMVNLLLKALESNDR